MATSSLSISREQVRHYELLQFNCAQSLMRSVEDVPDNGQGYAYFAKDNVRATLSANPYAVWATGAYGLTNATPETIDATINFFREHNVAPRLRIVPDGFTREQSARLAAHGLRHFGFHTIMHAALPIEIALPSSGIRVEHVTSAAEYDVALDVQLEGWGLPYNPDSPLKKLRRCWRDLADHRMYLAYLDGQALSHAMLFIDGKIAYLENASTIPHFRGRGLHAALIARRISDAIEMGCDTVVGGADFESVSRVNQMRAGLQIAYLAALWTA